MKYFYSILVNTLIANVTTGFLWYALTFWAYLATHSVLATAIIGGSYMLLVAMFGILFGTIVDHNKKKKVMMGASIFTLVLYCLAAVMFFTFSESSLVDWSGGLFWLFAGAILLGSVVENMRNIALSTVVTILVPKDARDKANGLVGTVQGVAFVATSVFSGLSIGLLGMGWTLGIAIAFTAISVVHLFFVQIPEEKIVHASQDGAKKVDIKGSIAAICAVPGLMWLIVFSTFNNLIGGVHMALMDPYGLTLFTVEWWGIVLGITSVGFIIGGALVVKFGLGKNPLRTLIIINIVGAVLDMVFAIRELWLLYSIGIFLYMMIIPIAEAAEQTILQRVVPLKRQGRVFGLAMSIETAASPLMAFMIGPLAQFIVIPFMNSPEGTRAFGWLLGTGSARGIALIFVIAGLVMLITALLVFTTRAYKNLSKYYQTA